MKATCPGRTSGTVLLETSAEINARFALLDDGKVSAMAHVLGEDVAFVGLRTLAEVEGIG